jgi:pimeloyl-ACP methyl ester carboxylesterase
MKGRFTMDRVFDRRRALQAGLLTIGAASLGTYGRSVAAQTPAATTTGDRIDIGGRSLYLERGGGGEPTVIFECGYRNNGQIWSVDKLPQTWEPAETPRTMVLPGVSAFASVVAYDRPGTFLDLDNRSRSDPVPMPRQAVDIVADLHALLVAADVPPPYVLVGHSLGGLLTRLYASTWPDNVAGLVQIDPYHEEVWERYRTVMTTEQWEAVDALNHAVPTELMQAYPEFEQMDFDSMNIQMQEAAAESPLRDIPFAVIAHGRSFEADTPEGAMPDDYPWDDVEAVTRELYAELASSVPGGRLVVAEESGHYIHLEQPDLVIDVIRQVVDAVRDPATWFAS